MLRLSAASLCLLAKRSMSVVVDEACAPRLRLALVRHGESMNNIHEAVSEAAYVANRHADPDLSPRGYRQADALGGFLANATRSAFLGVHRVDEVWVSPHRRTLLTVAPYAAASGHRPRVNTKLFEAGGVYDANDAFAARGGLARSEMAARHPTYLLPDDVTEDGSAETNGYKLRTGAISFGVPLITNEKCAYLFVESLSRHLKRTDKSILVRHLDEFYAGTF